MWLCHFLADVFAGITKFSLLLQKNETILEGLLLASTVLKKVLDISKQAVCALENLRVTTEMMAARPKHGGRLSQFMADLRLQRRHPDEKGEMPFYKFPVHFWFCFRYRNMDMYL